MIKAFQEKLSDVGAADYIQIKLSKPDFTSIFFLIQILWSIMFGLKKLRVCNLITIWHTHATLKSKKSPNKLVSFQSVKMVCKTKENQNQFL